MIESQTFYTIVVIGLLWIIATLLLGRLERTLRGRAACLRAAYDATEEFYNRAEVVLGDSRTPESVRAVLLGMTSVVTRKEAGRVALDCLVEAMSSGPEKINAPDGYQALHDDIEQLRNAHGDLYDAFNDALRASMAAVMLAYGPDHAKVEMEYRSQSFNLELANKVSKAVGRIYANASDRNGGHNTAHA